MNGFTPKVRETCKGDEQKVMSKGDEQKAMSKGDEQKAMSKRR